MHAQYKKKQLQKANQSLLSNGLDFPPRSVSHTGAHTYTKVSHNCYALISFLAGLQSAVFRIPKKADGTLVIVSTCPIRC